MFKGKIPRVFELNLKKTNSNVDVMFFAGMKNRLINGLSIKRKEQIKNIKCNFFGLVSAKLEDN